MWQRLQSISVYLTMVVCFSVVVSEAREWTDNTGNFKVEAEFVGLEDGQAMLKTIDGTVKRVPLHRLSEPDQAFVRRFVDEAKLKSKTKEKEKKAELAEPRWEDRGEKRKVKTPDVQQILRHFKELGFELPNLVSYVFEFKTNEGFLSYTLKRKRDGTELTLKRRLTAPLDAVPNNVAPLFQAGTKRPTDVEWIPDLGYIVSASRDTKDLAAFLEVADKMSPDLKTAVTECLDNFNRTKKPTQKKTGKLELSATNDGVSLLSLPAIARP